MQMKISDLLDRWTILRMKARLDDSAKEELKAYTNEVVDFMDSETWRRHPAFMIASLAQLAEANAKVWVCESAIRQEYANDPGCNGNLSLEEIGRRAIEIRGYNKLRIEAKQAIDTICGEVPDKKVDHASV